MRDGRDGGATGSQHAVVPVTEGEELERQRLDQQGAQRDSRNNGRRGKHLDWSEAGGRIQRTWHAGVSMWKSSLSRGRVPRCGQEGERVTCGMH